MKFIGYESYTSWIIAIGTCIINCTSQTPHRIAGLIFVSIVDYYETDRETASIPILTFIIVRCLGGPFCGIVGQKFSVESVTLYGSILAAIGFGACFFAENIAVLIICLGIIFGVGMTGSNTFLPSIVKKYFNKNLNTATGISQAGSCLGAILIPPIAVYLLDKYGLPGTFLIISAFMLHAIPISLIIKTSGVIQDKIVEATKRNKTIASEEKLSTSNQKSLPVSYDCNTSDGQSKIISMPVQLSINNQNPSSDLNDTSVSNQLSISNQKCPTNLRDTSVAEKLSLSDPQSHTNSEDVSVEVKLCINNEISPTASECTSKQVPVNNEENPPKLASKISEPSKILKLENENKFTFPEDSSSNISIAANNKTELYDSLREIDYDIESEGNSTALEHSNTHNNLPYLETDSTIDNRKREIDKTNHYAQSSKIQQIKETSLQTENPDITDSNITEASLLLGGLESDLEQDSKLRDLENKQISTPNTIVPMQNSTKSLPIEEELNTKSHKKNKYHFLKVFINIPFLIIMLTTGLHNFVSILVYTTMIDYSRDKGISRQNEVYFLMMHPFCEIIGRICFGWVTDLKYLTVTRYSMICFGIMGLTCAGVLFSTNFWTMMLGAFPFAIACGAMTAIFPGMVFNCVPEDLQSMAIASRYALSGPFIFTSAPLIGYFRENNGSYDGIYFLLIAICILCIAIMPLMDKFSSRTRKLTT